jgi:hypothetical protein
MMSAMKPRFYLRVGLLVGMVGCSWVRADDRRFT